MRRREAPVLVFSLAEAALSLRISENTLRVWAREGIIRTVRWQSLELVPLVEMEKFVNDALENGGTHPRLAERVAS